MRIKREKITPEMWAHQQIEYNWQEGVPAFLKRRPPTPEDLIQETRIYNKFERFTHCVLGGLFTIAVMSIGPILMMLALAMFIGIYGK